MGGWTLFLNWVGGKLGKEVRVFAKKGFRITEGVESDDKLYTLFSVFSTIFLLLVLKHLYYLGALEFSSIMMNDAGAA